MFYFCWWHQYFLFAGQFAAAYGDNRVRNDGLKKINCHWIFFFFFLIYTWLGVTMHFQDHRALHMLYCLLVLPYLSYCEEIWGNMYKSNLEPLSVVQKSAIRIVKNVGFVSTVKSIEVHCLHQIQNSSNCVQSKICLISRKYTDHVLWRGE